MSDYVYVVRDEDNIPDGLLQAHADGFPISVESSIGWIEVECPSFKSGMRYKVGDLKYLKDIGMKGVHGHGDG